MLVMFLKPTFASQPLVCVCFHYMASDILSSDTDTHDADTEGSSCSWKKGVLVDSEQLEQGDLD